MDIRTKLVFALVAVALSSMLALGLSGYVRARDLLREGADQTLQGIAESKADDLENVTASWIDRVRLIASRTQLRRSLEVYGRSHEASARNLITQIINDARDAVPAVRALTVFDTHGHPVASTSGTSIAAVPALDRARMRAVTGEVAYDGLRADGPDSLEVAFLAPLSIGSDTVGALTVVMSARELLDVARDYTGLGETGEILIAQRAGSDSAVVINPPRRGRPRTLGLRVSLERLDDPVVQALLGHERTAAAIDYRGKQVLAATRYLDALDWGLVVKFDADERERDVLTLRDDMLRTAIAISGLAVVLGVLLGFHFARPIHELAEVANRIRAGERYARADTRSDDEIGLLARTFNQMADELIEANEKLAREIAQRDNDEPRAGPRS